MLSKEKMYKRKSKILIVAAHPDDEVLGCGGTIARLSNEGHDVFIAILGEGIASRHDNKKDIDAKSIKKLHNQSKNVSEKLGAKKLFMYSLPDNQFDTVPFLEIVKIIEKLIDETNPSTIYTHFSGDLNIDHQITNRAVITASRPIEETLIKEIFTFEVPSSTDWSFGQTNKYFNPSRYIDIFETLDVMLDSMSLYENEIKPFPHPRSIKALKALAQYRGSIVGLKAAECFEVVRQII